MMLNWTGLTGVAAGLVAAVVILMAFAVSLAMLWLTGCLMEIIYRRSAPALAGLRSRWAIWRKHQGEAAGLRRVQRAQRRVGVAPIGDVAVRTPALERDCPAPGHSLRTIKAGKHGLLVSTGAGATPVALDPHERALIRRIDRGWEVVERQNAVEQDIPAAEPNKLEGHEPCWCGSGRTFSGCHLPKGLTGTVVVGHPLPDCADGGLMFLRWDKGDAGDHIVTMFDENWKETGKWSAGGVALKKVSDALFDSLRIIAEQQDDRPLEDSRDGLDEPDIEERLADLGHVVDQRIQYLAGRMSPIERQIKRLCDLSPRVSALEADAKRVGETPTESSTHNGTGAWLDQIKAKLAEYKLPTGVIFETVTPEGDVIGELRGIWKPVVRVDAVLKSAAPE